MVKMVHWVLGVALALGALAPVEGARAIDQAGLRARLAELKQMRDEGLVPANVYEAEVAKAVAAFTGSGTTEAPPKAPAAGEPAAQPAAAPKVPAAPAGKTAVQDTPIPPIEWGQLDLYFTIRKVGKGIVKEKRFTGDLEIYPAITFEVLAKDSFSLATTLFEAVFLDPDGYEMTSYPVDIKEKYGHLNWRPGMRGTGRIGLVGIELSGVGRIKIRRSFGGMF